MPMRLDTTQSDFAARFAALLAMKREVSEDVDAAARDIIADFITGGACEVSAFAEATDDGHQLVTFTFAGPPGAFKGVSGKVSTELMRMDGATAINVAIVTFDVTPSSTLPVEMRI